MFLECKQDAMAEAQIVDTRITVGDYRTRVLGVSGRGPLVLLLHGFADSADTWRPLLLELAARGQRAAAVDLPGFGAASGVGRTDLLDEYDRFITATLQVLHPGDGPADSGPVADPVPAVVVGNSMGATLALRAGTDRSDVGAVVALAPAGLGFHPVLHAMSGALDRLLPALRVAYKVPYPTLYVQTLIAAYYRARLAPGLRNAWHFGSHFDGMRDFRRIGALGRRLMTEVQAGCLDFSTMTRPVILVWGSADPVCDIGGAGALIDAVAGSRLVAVPGSGHLPQIEAPGVVADAIGDAVALARG
ncbi:alpha/beta fold hydrolase [Gordonia sp. HY442]|uniref:alpha/beta fold hydrolase n=1 Tax=Gordonia zhenghanii TaxID=2911516 RepID=UPI001F16DFDB|nr:alpha/beta fold hydrolase [Gordonia zhenghanii]MCF8602062.1 alpha/beta fold hydrolase [Gordonia zhenghanii]